MFKQTAGPAASETLVNCPFNHSHRFIAAKLVFHINKCKDRQKLGHLFQVCPYNKVHWVRRQQYKHHLKICKNRSDFKCEDSPEDESQEIRKNSVNSKKVKQDDNQQEKRMDEEKPAADIHEDMTLSDCEECQSIIRSPMFQEMMNSSRKLKKYMDRYNKLAQQEEEITKLRRKAQ